MKTSDVDILIVPGWLNSGPGSLAIPLGAQSHDGAAHRAGRLARPRQGRVGCQHRQGGARGRAAGGARCAQPRRHRRRLCCAEAHRGLGRRRVPRRPGRRRQHAELAGEPGARVAARTASASRRCRCSRCRSPRCCWRRPTIPIARRRGRKAFADAWGANFVDVGQAGHIADQSGHGPWPDGRFALRPVPRRPRGLAAQAFPAASMSATALASSSPMAARSSVSEIFTPAAAKSL